MEFLKQTRAHLEGGALWLTRDMRVSFQRCLVPADGFHHQTPRSLGILAVAADANGAFYLPVADGEGFWLGISTGGSGGSFQLFAEIKNGQTVNVRSGRRKDEDPATEYCFSGFGAIHGIGEIAETRRAFRRVAEEPACACERLIFVDSHRTHRALIREVSVRLVSYESYTEYTAQPPPAPLEPQAGYGGWLLP